MSIQIAAKAKKHGIAMDFDDAFDHPTIEEQINLQAAKTAPVASQSLVSGKIQLTPIQQWFFDQQFCNCNHFNQAFLLKTKESFDLNSLNRAFKSLLAHHDVLRSRFYRKGEIWEQYQDERIVDQIVVERDLSGCSGQNACSVVEDECARAQGDLALKNGDILKVILFRMPGKEEDRLFVCIHHLVVDNLSWMILLDDLQIAYRQIKEKRGVKLPPKTTPYMEWAAHLLRYSESEEMKASLEYWDREFRKGAAGIRTDFVHGENNVGSVVAVRKTLSVDIVSNKNAFQSHDLFLTALGYAFAEWTRDAPVLIDIEGHGRGSLFDGIDVSRTVGWFTAIYPFYLDVRRSDPAYTALSRVRKRLASLPNNGIDFGILSYMGDCPLRAYRKEAADVLVLFHGRRALNLNPDGYFTVASESPGSVQDPLNRRPYRIEIAAGVTGSQLEIAVSYSRNLHSERTLEDFLKRFSKAIKWLSESPSKVGLRL